MPLTPAVRETLRNAQKTEKLRRQELTPAEYAAHLKAEALAHPDDPGYWARYCVYVSNKPDLRPSKPAKPPRVKPPLVNPLELGQSRLIETLQQGPDPVYPEDPTPEEPESR
jgi:hypothetical protein